MEATAITVRAPATSANVGAGFDCLGLALDLFASVTVTFDEAERPPGGDAGETMAVAAARVCYERIGRAPPLLADPARGQDPERPVPHLDLEAASGPPHHEREPPALALAQQLRKVRVGGRREGGDPAPDPLEQEVDGGAHR